MSERDEKYMHEIKRLEGERDFYKRRLAEAEAAARWLYRQYLLRGPDSECVTERWPWLNSLKSSKSWGGEA